MTDSSPKLRVRGVLSVNRIRGAAPARIATVTVLFADLRGYTGLAEQLPPAQVVPLLDEFFGLLARCTSAHGGMVYYMAGDGMMAGFGGEGEDTRSAARKALSAGHDMLQSFAALATRWRNEHDVETGIGVGLHLGEVALGFLGPPGQRSRTLVGDTVNVAARLCSRARAGELLLSCAVAAALDIDDHERDLFVGPIPVLHLPKFTLRGRTAPLDIWCVPASERAVV